MELATIKNRLQQYKIKPSLHRIAILDFLMKHPIHPTIDMIFNELYESIPTLSKTTVYNTLKLLEEKGAVQAILIDEKNIRYDADLSVHGHFRCKKCGGIYDLELKNVDNISIKNGKKLMITECQVYYKGYCETCKKEMN